MNARTAGLFLFLGLLACAPKPGTVAISVEEKVFLDKMKQREDARADLRLTPDKYIKGVDWRRYDSGIFNDYTRATAVEFANNSDFDVTEIRGKITYLSASFVEMAIVPFTASGELPAGARAKLSVSAGEISGRATNAKVTVESVRVRN